MFDRTPSGPVVTIDARRIVDGDSFNDVFQEAFGFPGFYGRNMHAWIDCMGYLDAPEAEMSNVHVGLGEVLTLRIEHADDFRRRMSWHYGELVECTALVNERMSESTGRTLVVLEFFG